MTRDRVIVVGGGLAGLAAAVELVERDFAVTVIEASTQCGGKLAFLAHRHRRSHRTWNARLVGRTT